MRIIKREEPVADTPLIIRIDEFLGLIRDSREVKILLWGFAAGMFCIGASVVAVLSYLGWTDCLQ